MTVYDIQDRNSLEFLLFEVIGFPGRPNDLGNFSLLSSSVLQINFSRVVVVAVVAAVVVVVVVAVLDWIAGTDLLLLTH